MKTKTVKLTPQMLRQLVKEEAAKLGSKNKIDKSTEEVAKKTKEVDAGEEADALENQVNFVKAAKIKESLKLKEQKALRVLKKIREAQKRLARKRVTR